jgi:ferredoxin-type protein NapH
LAWNRVGLQLVHSGSVLGEPVRDVLGLLGLRLFIACFVVLSIVSWVGTALLGRRRQCSMACLFDGFAAEILDPAIPLVGRKRRFAGVPAPYRPILRTTKWTLLALDLAITAAWCVVVVTGSDPSFLPALKTFETIEYLLAELLVAMCFWVALSGRGRRHYCPTANLRYATAAMRRVGRESF